MNSSLLKKALPHIIAIAVFLVIAIVYCKPALDGKVVYQQDVIGWKGTAQQSFEFNEKHGHFPLWTESTFSGMPAYTIAMEATSGISTRYLIYLVTFNLPKPICFFFLACICMYILTQVLRINPWIGIMAALSFGYCTFNSILIAVGHETEMYALGYAPAVIAGLLLIYQRKYLLGAALLSIFFGFQEGTQHLQIVYYTGIIMGCITVAYVVYCWKQKQLKEAFKGVAVALVAGAIGFGTFAISILPLQEYAKETMRGGKSELTTPGDSKIKTKGGLDKDYAFDWSYGIPETFTFIIPGIYGGGSDGRQITASSKFVEKAAEIGLPEEAALQYGNSYSYWGTQHSTSGPVYLGAIVCFLFIFGVLYVKSWHKWWILGAAIFGILLAWGKNFSSLNYFLFDYLPFYNKFRAPSMALVIPQLVFPLLGALGLNELLFSQELKEVNWKKFKTAAYIAGGLMAVLIAFYFTADYKTTRDATLKERFSSMVMQSSARGKQPTPEIQQQANEVSNTLLKGLQADRQSIYGADLLRTILLLAIAVVIIGLFLKDKIKPGILIAGLTVLSAYDLIAEGRIYLNGENFIEPADFESAFIPTAADLKIKNDPDKNARVFDETAESGPFQDSRASYHHNSVGGYSPVKLGLYQDIIENQLSKGNKMVYNMLNTKYFIQANPATKQPDAFINPDAFGACWLVKNIHYVNNANEEMKALDSINVRDTAIVRKSFENVIKFTPVPDSTASVKLVENLNDKVSYSFSSKTNQFAVFSEVYYDKGWNAYLDGSKTDYCRVDYVLRGMPVPAGEHKIEFRFEPAVYKLGNTISVWATILSYLLLIGAIVMAWRKRDQLA